MKFIKFFQNNDEFYPLFEQAVSNNFLAAKELNKLCKEFKDPQKSAKKIHELEHKGDALCHDIFAQLNKSFITPIDREDIIALTNAIDDVIDLIHSSADDINNYYIKKPTSICIKMTENIVLSTQVVKNILPKIQKRKTFSEVIQGVREINQLETQADELLKEGIQSLFKKPKSAVDIIKWQSIYQTMEDVTDKCEDIADVLNGLVVKYA